MGELLLVAVELLDGLLLCDGLFQGNYVGVRSP